MHEVLLRIWRRRGEFTFHDPLAYLYQAVRNEAQSWHRREARQRLRTTGYAAAAPTSYPGPDPSQLIEGKELARLVETVVEALPPRRREIFRLQREQRLSYAEIASLLGILIKTVETQIGQALKAIRRELGHLLVIALVLTL